MEKKYKWEKRSPEWIKANPGQPTMYKVLDDGTELPTKSLPKAKPVAIKPYRADAGIYAIICEVEHMAYVGQSENTGTRMRGHKATMTTPGAKTKHHIYDRMQEHIAKHGIESFKFVKMRPMPEANTVELLAAECDTMLEFLEMGYGLYNRSIPIDLMNIYLPQIAKLLSGLSSGAITDKDLNEWIEQKGVKRLTA